MATYAAIPAFTVDGEALDDQVLDGIVEAMEINPGAVQVMESGDAFYIIIKDNSHTYESIMESISTSKSLEKSYEATIFQISKLLRKSDKFCAILNTVRGDISRMKEEKKALNEELSRLKDQRREQKKKAMELKNEIDSYIDSSPAK